tara:strand:+ start:167 stop:721 length:555 start_codon:yes stop_codon:yes gene_type:complete
MIKENRREAKQIEYYGLIGNPRAGRGSNWVPDAVFPDGELVELKTGHRRRRKDGSWGWGQFSTTRNYTLKCFNTGAYAKNVHWVLAYYDKDNDDQLYEHWYCAPGWLDEWQKQQQHKLMYGRVTRLEELLQLVGPTDLRDVLIKQIHLNDPKISSSYIENSPLCVRFDGTTQGLLEAKDKLTHI